MATVAKAFPDLRCRRRSRRPMSFPTSSGGRGSDEPIAKVLAGPVPEQVASVTVKTRSGQRIEAEVTDAFDLRWFGVELARGERAKTVTARNSEGSSRK